MRETNPPYLDRRSLSEYIIAENKSLTRRSLVLGAISVAGTVFGVMDYLVRHPESNDKAQEAVHDQQHNKPAESPRRYIWRWHN